MLSSRGPDLWNKLSKNFTSMGLGRARTRLNRRSHLDIRLAFLTGESFALAFISL